MSENWKVQASFKFGANNADMLNVRADSAEELSELISGLTNVDLVGAGNAIRSGVAVDNAATDRISQVAKSLGATIENTYWEEEPQPKAAPAPVAPPKPVAPAAPAASNAPLCQHGPMRLVPAGISKKTGKPYNAFWSCTSKDRGSQCDAVSIRN